MAEGVEIEIEFDTNSCGMQTCLISENDSDLKKRGKESRFGFQVPYMFLCGLSYVFVMFTLAFVTADHFGIRSSLQLECWSGDMVLMQLKEPSNKPSVQSGGEHDLTEFG